MNATAVGTDTRAQPEWFASWFDSEHYHRLYAHRDRTEAAGFIEALLSRLAPASGASVLDLGCGSGRHAINLAARRLDVTGLDLSAESIGRAKHSEGPNLRFVRQDMRQAFGTGAFDFVFNLFTSFGYFDEPVDDLSVIHNIAASLKAGGCVVLDYLNVSHAESHLTAEEVVERDGVVYRISRWSDAKHIFKKIVVHDGAAVALEHIERVAKLTVEDFRFMFEVCNLRIEETYGDYRLSPFDVDTSGRLILQARKIESVPELFPREILANAADGLGCHAQIRREHGLGDPLRD